MKKNTIQNFLIGKKNNIVETADIWNNCFSLTYDNMIEILALKWPYVCICDKISDREITSKVIEESRKIDPAV